MTTDTMTQDMPAIDTVSTSIDTESAQGFFQTTFQDFSFDSLLAKIHLTREALLEIALCFGAGFLLGFLFKKYNYYFFVLAFFIGALWVADYYAIISLTINVSMIKSFLGCSALPADATILSCLVSTVQEHVRATVSFISGFVLGLWVG